MSYENIIVETRGRVGLIRLNRPQALNALNSALIADVSRAVDAFEADGNIGCMVITGSEKAFAAGADIKQMADKSFIEAYMGDFAAHWDRVANARKPTIAAVAGFALGGGCELAMQCDIIIAADNAKFGQPEIKLGDHSRHRRHAALHPRGRQGEGDGHHADRPHDGRRGGGARGPRRAHRAGGEPCSRKR